MCGNKRDYFGTGAEVFMEFFNLDHATRGMNGDVFWWFMCFDVHILALASGI